MWIWCKRTIMSLIATTLAWTTASHRRAGNQGDNLNEVPVPVRREAMLNEDSTNRHWAAVYFSRIDSESLEPLPVFVGSLTNSGDSALDLVLYYFMPGPQNALNVMLSHDDGSFLTATNYNLSPMGGTAAVADFNGDGKLDFVVATAAHDVKIFIGDGSGAFVSVTNYSI